MAEQAHVVRVRLGIVREDEAEQGGLPRAVGADKGPVLPVADAPAHPAEHGRGPASDRDAPQLDDRGTRRCPAAGRRVQERFDGSPPRPCPWTLGDDLAAADPQDIADEAGHVCLARGDDNEREAAGRCMGEEPGKPSPRPGVQALQGLLEHEQARLGQQRFGDEKPACLAVGQAAHLPAHDRPQAEQAHDHAAGGQPARCRRLPPACRIRARRRELLGGRGGAAVLEALVAALQVAAVPRDAAGLVLGGHVPDRAGPRERPRQRAPDDRRRVPQRSRECCLARPVGADDRPVLARHYEPGGMREEGPAIPKHRRIRHLHEGYGFH